MQIWVPLKKFNWNPPHIMYHNIQPMKDIFQIKKKKKKKKRNGNMHPMVTFYIWITCTKGKDWIYMPFPAITNKASHTFPFVHIHIGMYNQNVSKWQQLKR